MFALILIFCFIAVNSGEFTTSSTPTSTACQSIAGDLLSLTGHILSLKNNSDEIRTLSYKVYQLERENTDIKESLSRLELRMNSCGCSNTLSSSIVNAVTSPTTKETIDPTVNEDYAKALEMSILFYEAQRSGHLPDDNRITWRGDSALDDKGYNGEDLTGGWYDAGDYVKFGFPMASSVTLLLWGISEFKDAYVRSGQYSAVLGSVRWPLDYFLRCHVSPNQFYAQVGDSILDHAYWGRPEDMGMRRPAFMLNTTHPGTEVAAETAAAMAAGSLVFKDVDAVYSKNLLEHSKQLYSFAEQYKLKYTISIPEAKSGYDSYSGYEDELAWAALWLFKATGDQNYVIKSSMYIDSGLAYALSWDLKTPGNQMLYYEATGDPVYKKAVETYLKARFPGGQIPRTPRGLTYRAEWSVLQYSGNDAFLALVAANKDIMTQQCRVYALSQINYILGKTTGIGYVVGYGNNPPLHAHHAAASCPSPPKVCDWSTFSSTAANAHVIAGAVVGGPDINDIRIDKRDKYKFSEVSCTLNAGYQSALAGLIVIVPATGGT